jgi:hypothetical protein
MQHIIMMVLTDCDNANISAVVAEQHSRYAPRHPVTQGINMRVPQLN